MRPRPSVLAVCLAVICTFPQSKTYGQSALGRLIDGYTVGLGISLYQGDLDRNPTNSFDQLLTLGNLHLMAGADRSVAGGRGGLEIHYNRLIGANAAVSGTHHVVSMDITYGRPVRSDAVRVYLGIGPALVFSSYDRSTPTADVFGFISESSGFDLTIPFGVIIQDRVRLSTRFALLDRVDGTERIGGKDMISNVVISYRFEVPK